MMEPYKDIRVNIIIENKFLSYFQAYFVIIWNIPIEGSWQINRNSSRQYLEPEPENSVWNPDGGISTTRTWNARRRAEEGIRFGTRRRSVSPASISGRFWAGVKNATVA